MKEILRFNSLVKIGVVVIFIYLLIGSCANTSTPPLGGPKDTIPPVLLYVSPDSGKVNFAINKGIIELKFNEYVVLKEEQQNIFLSPPLDKKPITKIRGKGIVVSFPVALDSAQTYSLNFGRSIVDNNEGNIFPSFVYPFSTGAVLDSMYTSGTVYHAQTLLPAQDVTVALYENLSDTAIYKVRPSAISKTDKFGYFVVRNIKSTPYRVFAFKDNNYNNRYDPENESIAFLDTVFTPSNVLNSTLAELQFVKEKDTLAALNRPAQLDLYLFVEDNEKQFIRESKRPTPKMVFVKFSAAEPQIISLKFDNIDSSSIKTEYNIRRDSMVVWLTDTLLTIPDSLKFSVEYMKTDTLDSLSLFKEEFSLVAPKPKKESNIADQKERDSRSERVRSMTEKKKRANLLEYKIEADPTLFEQKGFSLIFDAPLAKFVRDSVSIVYKSPRGDSSVMEYEILTDSLWSRLINIKPNGRVLKGYEYYLRILPNAFTDIYKHTNDSTNSKVSLPQDENLSKLILNITGGEGSYIVELTNITRDKVFRSYKINGDTTLEFPYLQKGKYSVKIIEDINGNGIIDTGNLKRKKQPEKVRLFALPDGSTIITIPESVELKQDINLKTIFN